MDSSTNKPQKEEEEEEEDVHLSLQRKKTPGFFWTGMLKKKREHNTEIDKKKSIDLNLRTLFREG